ncbi:juvenile hormone esterase-like [Schistocerca nitens]|uniref:juvenile hormone esterase-like n=1 Tax=Schistocerca nitens TaxID=7011 RepID=UPI002117C2CD|nr:juvenile hormone esterase-like [Schistocerca nitens]
MATPANGAITISFPQGALRGRKLRTPSGRPYCSFQGIPYAKPPVGPLRFMAPEPAEQWSGILNAMKEGHIAPQRDFITKQYGGDEDCLYVNVYTPKIPTNVDKQLVPVMVWIHGGGYSVGSGNSDLHGPEYLLENDVVIVTFNYRLGVLGFLSTGDEVIPGNAGLKDQVMALRWVRNNISHFGGDPENVTIFGESAGAFSCHLLILSPATKGLFHRAILQSGATSRESVCSSLRDRTFRLAKFLGFTGDSSEGLLAFMRDQPPRKLVENMEEAFTQEDKLKLDLFAFLPTIEPESIPGAVLTEDPLELLKSGKFHRIPIIFGINSREGILFLLAISNNESAMREINTNFHKALPCNLPVKKDDRVTTAREIRRLYFCDKRLDGSTIELYGDLRGDLMFGYPALTAARIHSSVPAAQPVYFYHFDVVTTLNRARKMVVAENVTGVAHADELPYLFTSEAGKEDEIPSDSVEAKTIARLTRLWTNFAKTGNPTPDHHDPLFAVTWPPFSSEDRSYLDIANDGLRVKKDLMKDRMLFWDKIYGSSVTTSPVLHQELYTKIKKATIF